MAFLIAFVLDYLYIGKTERESISNMLVKMVVVVVVVVLVVVDNNSP
jgi:hypothetical protein